MAPANDGDFKARLMTHEAVCAERYESINARLKRIEKILMWAAGTMITGGAGLGFTMLTMLLKQ
jgi:hypothetical protein